MDYQIGFWTLFACFCLSAFETGFKVGFEKWKAGRKKKVWHGPEDVPDDDKECFFIKKNGSATLACCDDNITLWDEGWPVGHMYDVKKWAYVKDLEELE